MRTIRPSEQVIALALLLVLAVTAAGEVCPNPQVPKAERDAADPLLLLSDTEQAEALQTHLSFGFAACPRLLPERGQRAAGAAWSDQKLTTRTGSRENR